MSSSKVNITLQIGNLIVVKVKKKLKTANYVIDNLTPEIWIQKYKQGQNQKASTSFKTFHLLVFNLY